MSSTATYTGDASPSDRPEKPAPTTVELTGLHVVWEALLAAKADEQRAVRLREELAAMIQDRMGDAEIGLLDGRPVASFEHSKRTILRTQLVRERHPHVARECEDTIPVRTFRILGS